MQKIKKNKLSSKHRIFIVIILLLSINASLVSQINESSPHPTTVEIWHKWSFKLTNTLVYDNPYADVTVKVRYTGTRGKIINGLAFWDGSDIFRLNCMFPETGTWRWRTECSDSTNTSLHNKTGQVHVISNSNTENALYEHGYLKPSENGRFLTFDDRTPFL